MNYLDIFDNAKVWIKYVHFLNKKYYRNDFLEVGAGIGSFTDNYEKNIKNIFLTEIDENNLNILKSKYKNNLNKNLKHHNYLLHLILQVHHHHHLLLPI